MRSRLAILFLASALGACSHTAADIPARGVESVNVPVVERQDFAFDAAAPGGELAPYEVQRLDSWFQGLGLSYGDTVYVDGAYADSARNQVAQLAGQYGLMVSAGAPITSGPLAPQSVRVVVSRNRATVPSCPNWSMPSQPNYNNRTMSNFGCAVNGNFAAMVANPEDLINGREGNAVVDAQTAAKAIGSYRGSPPTGKAGLPKESTKEGN